LAGHVVKFRAVCGLFSVCVWYVIRPNALMLPLAAIIRAPISLTVA